MALLQAVIGVVVTLSLPVSSLGGSGIGAMKNVASDVGRGRMRKGMPWHACQLTIFKALLGGALRARRLSRKRPEQHSWGFNRRYVVPLILNFGFVTLSVHTQ